MDQQLKAFFRQWADFIVIIFNPWVLTLLLPIAYLTYQTSAIQNDPLISTILSVMIAVSSGLLGGIIANKWSALNDESVLSARGRSAVRSLKLLLMNITAIERRVIEYTHRTKNNPSQTETSVLYLEEIAVKCRTLQEEVINSIENWTDIVPEANITTQIGIITELHDTIRVKEEEKRRLEDNLEEAGKQSAEEAEKLRLALQQKEQELIQTWAELRRQSNQTFGGAALGTIYSGQPISGGGSIIYDAPPISSQGKTSINFASSPTVVQSSKKPPIEPPTST